mmetsp:Transcript_26468/g.67219  ORF Transcript_26468/g.67219 Transcript_26468/m.67219 type:complete len:737 (-) Transcript_26468:276-2486(-)
MATCVECGTASGCPAKPPPPPKPPPLPAMPPFDYDARSPGALRFAGRGGKLLANGKPFHIKGVNWVGSEARAGPPLGLDKHNIAWYMEWLRSNKFNAIRLLFNHEMILSDAPLEPPNEVVYGKGAPWESPELEGYHYLEMFAKITEVAAEHGIMIMMAAHRLHPDAWPGKGLWYDERMTEERVKESWAKISERMCKQWNFFAVDLQNEPHASSWAKHGGKKDDWGLAAGRLGNHMLTQCARLLIFVEGVGYSPGAAGMDNAGDGIWWGENLAGVKKEPVVLYDQSKLVYSPHTYGPSVYAQGYFAELNFPNNMPAIWQARFDFVREMTGSPVVIGEMGGFYTGSDKRWQDWAISYCVANEIGLFYFALGPESDDTGGLLKEDYTTVETAKLKMLEGLPSTDAMQLHLDTAHPLPPPQPRPPPPSPKPPPSSPPSPPPPSPPPPPTRPDPPAPSPKPSVPASASAIEMAIHRSHQHPPPPPPAPRIAIVARVVEHPHPPPSPCPPPPAPTAEGIMLERAQHAPAPGIVERTISALADQVFSSPDADPYSRGIAVIAIIAGFALVGTLCIICIFIGLAAWLCRGKRRGYSRPAKAASTASHGESLECVGEFDGGSEESFGDHEHARSSPRGGTPPCRSSAATYRAGSASLPRARAADNPMVRLSEELSASLSRIHELQDHADARMVGAHGDATLIDDEPLDEAYPDMSAYLTTEPQSADNLGAVSDRKQHCAFQCVCD